MAPTPGQGNPSCAHQSQCIMHTCSASRPAHPPTCHMPPPPAPSGGTLRVKGRNLTENEYVKLGAYHSLELEQQRAFTVHKACWDVLDIERIKQATDPKLSADLAAVLIVVSGTARSRLSSAAPGSVEPLRSQQDLCFPCCAAVNRAPSVPGDAIASG